jgi:DNA repair protein RadC
LYRSNEATALTNSDLSQVSDQTVIAALLKPGNDEPDTNERAARLLAHFGSLSGLQQASPDEIVAVVGAADYLLAALELVQRLTRLQPDARPIVSDAASAARLVMDMGRLPQEAIRTILVDTAHRVIAMPTIYIGTVNATVLRAAEVYREAVRRNAPALILAHNHPSGDPSPSPEDISLTRTLIAAGETLDIILLDHLIIAGSEWRSLKEMGLAF